MTKRNHNLNHSRPLDTFSKDVAEHALHYAKNTPTQKQVKFYKRLYATCKEHGISIDTGFFTRTRAQYAEAIDILLKRLKENGIDARGNGKTAIYSLEDKFDHMGNEHYTEEKIILQDESESSETTE